MKQKAYGWFAVALMAALLLGWDGVPAEADNLLKVVFAIGSIMASIYCLRAEEEKRRSAA